MKRRNFLSTLIGGIAIGAAERTFPFRVYSFAAPVKPKYTSVWSFKNGVLVGQLSENGLVVAEYTELDAQMFQRETLR
jgi:hypothetical protein